MSDSVRDFSPWASSAVEAAKESKFGTKGSLGDEDDASVIFVNENENWENEKITNSLSKTKTKTKK